MNYSAPEIVLILGALGAVVVNVVQALKVSSKLDDVHDKVSENTQKTAIIEGHVNSERTRLGKQLRSMQKEIDMLNSTIAEKDKTAALLAQSLANKKEKSDEKSPS